jgi:TRAP-type transport system large permease protein
MHYDLVFWWSLASLSLIVIYAVLVFKNIEPLIAVAICVGLGFLINKSSPIEIGHILAKSLSGFLALIGLIIMLGRGLGEVLAETHVIHTLVHKIVYSIGVNTQVKVKTGIILASLLIVGSLGTLAGGLAILAPILCPIAANVGLTRPAVAVLFQASAEEALILGPFTPSVITILGVTGLTYPHLLLYAALPISLVTIIISWIMANRLQCEFSSETFDTKLIAEQFIPNKQQKLATTIFIVGFIGCVTYGLIYQAKTSFVIFVMAYLAISTGLFGGLSIAKIFELLIRGMKKNFHLFVIFLLLGPFLHLIQSAGGFKALAALFIPLIQFGGKPVTAILTGLTGAFAMPAASPAVIKMLYEMFSKIAAETGLSITTFAFSILLATRITNFVYPGANMFAAMGFAGSENIKAMIKNGLTVASVQVVFLIIYSLLFA